MTNNVVITETIGECWLNSIKTVMKNGDEYYDEDIRLKEILGLDVADEEVIIRNLKDILELKRGKLKSVEFDPTKNTEYDEEWAKIGKNEKVEEAEPSVQNPEDGD